ncbi:MAG: hypothetical protein HY806_02005 [Nitrospirae bacterium]|nr:hypothetical protein [Nitrospirota bacterium]
MIRTKQYRRSFMILGALLVLVVSGCAFGNFGKTVQGGYGIDEPSGIIGNDKSSVLTTLGVPDSMIIVNDTEYWAYRNKSGWFVMLVGVTKEKDLVIEFKGNKVVSANLVAKGTSIGILAAQGTVAN